MCSTRHSHRPGTRVRLLVVFWGSILAAGVPRASAEATPELASAPRQATASDPEVQTLIRAYVNAEAVNARQTALADLRALDQQRRPHLLQQVVLHVTQNDGPRTTLGAGALLAELAIADMEAVRALTPLLDDADAQVRKQAGNILGGYEDASAERPPDYSIYREILADAVRADRPLPAGLVEHMYDRAPGVALRSVMRAVQIRDPQRLQALLWGEHVVAEVLWRQAFGFLEPTQSTPEAQEQLARLAGDEAWWVRLYVAEIMAQHAGLRDKAVLETLRQDENRLVRQVVDAIAAS